MSVAAACRDFEQLKSNCGFMLNRLRALDELTLLLSCNAFAFAINGAPGKALRATAASMPVIPGSKLENYAAISIPDAIQTTFDTLHCVVSPSRAIVISRRNRNLP